MKFEIKHYKVLELPKKLNPNVVYYVLEPNTKRVEGYITDLNGVPIKLLEIDGGVVTGTGVTGTLQNPKVNVSTFVSTQLGNQVELSVLDGKLVVAPLTSPNNSININKTSTELQVQLSYEIQSQINTALQPGDNISNLVNDIGYVTILDIVEDKNFMYTKNIPDDVWIIDHTLNKFPSVTVKDSSGRVVFGQTDYVNTTKIILTFNGAFSGFAILN